MYKVIFYMLLFILTGLKLVRYVNYITLNPVVTAVLCEFSHFLVVCISHNSMQKTLSNKKCQPVARSTAAAATRRSFPHLDL